MSEHVEFTPRHPNGAPVPPDGPVRTVGHLRAVLALLPDDTPVAAVWDDHRAAILDWCISEDVVLELDVSSFASFPSETRRPA